MRVRIKSKFSPDKLKNLYSKGFDPSNVPESVLRILHTIAFANWVKKHHRTKVIADLSLGDGAVIKGIMDATPKPGLEYIFGDLAEVNVVRAKKKFGGTPNISYIHKPIEQALLDIEDRKIDLFISSETIEHLDNPDAVLSITRQKAKRLVLTTPEDEPKPDGQHYWTWGFKDVEEMLIKAGFKPLIYQKIDNSRNFHFGNKASYQMWFCE